MTSDIWQGLTPESAMTAVESVMGCQLRPLCLFRNSYINRVFEMEMDSGERIIAKFYRPERWSREMILGEHRLLQACEAAEVSVIAPLIIEKETLFLFNDRFFFALFEKKGGRVVDELDLDHWERCGQLLARLHAVSAQILDSGRMIWRPSVASVKHLDTLESLAVIPEDYRTVFKQSTQRFIDVADPLFDTVPLHLIHGDMHFGNIINRPGEALFLLDFDDCVVGPAAQDVWMLLPEDWEACPNEVAAFRSGYTVFRDFPSPSPSLIAALRLMRQLHFGAWAAIQHEEAHFQAYFPDWGSTAYWNLFVKDLMGFEAA